MLDRIVETLSDGKKLSGSTIAKRLGVSRRAVMAECLSNTQLIRRVDPLEVGWGATYTKSKIFTLI